MLDFWKKGFVMKGVATRKEFWLSYLVWLAIPVGTLLVLNHQMGQKSFELTSEILTIIWCFSIYLVIAFIPSITISVRRLHDIGKPGNYYLLNLIPYLGSLIFLAHMLTPSKVNSQYRL